MEIKIQYGHYPTQDEVSDEDLSELCNQVLLTELKAFALLPKVVSFIDSSGSAICEASKNDQLVEYHL